MGRSKELAAIRMHWTEGSRLVVLVGPPGAGKARLARHLCRGERQVMSFDRASSIDVNAVAARGDVLVSIADAGEAVVDRLVDAAPSARILVTSRRRLEVDGAAIVRVGPLDPEAAHALFVARARLVRHDFDARAPRLAELLARLDRLPRAIEAVAAGMGIASVDDILARVESALDAGTGSAEATLREDVDAMLATLSSQAFSLLASLARGPRLVALGDLAVRDVDFLHDRALVRPGDDGSGVTIYEHVRHRVLERLAEAAPPSRPALRLAATAPTGALIVEARGRAFTLPDGTCVDLETRAPLQRILACLARARSERAGTTVSSEELLASGWPRERMAREAGLHRVHVAIATLRKMGLAPILIRLRAGYLLDPRVRTTLRDEPGNDTVAEAYELSEASPRS